MRAALVLVLVVAVAVNGASIDRLKARVSGSLSAGTADDFTTTQECATKGGVCGEVSACASKQILHNLCPGNSQIACCIQAAAPAAPTTPTPPVTPPAPPVTPPAPGGASLAGLIGLVPGSACAKFNFAGRGTAPTAYLQGLAISYAKAVCKPDRADLQVVGSSAITGAEDVLSWYSTQLAVLGARSDGLSTIRQLYTLLTGLGMRESSGTWCAGRDTTAHFTQAGTAEAGLFQTSYNSGHLNAAMGNLMTAYRASSAGCAASTYQRNVKCSAKDLQNWGAPTDMGFIWQALTKNCPAFATDWALVLLRFSGGKLGEWGPLRTHAAQVRPECFNLYKSVESYVAANPGICDIVYATN